MKQLYLLLSKNKTVFFEFYNGKNLKQTNAIVVEDAFADILSIDEHGNLDFSVNITNPNDVKTLFSFFSQKMTSQDLLLRSCTSKETTVLIGQNFIPAANSTFLIPMDLSFFCRRKPLTILWKQQNPIQSWISQNL